ncbi:hypothetical protein Ddye_028424 [Dipteronia dyeriana]|uniref:Uncharacterized protein n=1 Tax=Dipteronia dyeriana TaxID=168575 RepID=A0AAD9TQX3_9ROSI|nr:hypothetical protein Ddye_028424 [Dipteronia dyeriana]
MVRSTWLRRLAPTLEEQIGCSSKSNSRKDGIARRNGSGPLRSGVDIPDKAGDSRKDVGTTMVDFARSENVSRKVLASSKGVKIGTKSVGGSIFSILSERMEGDIDMGRAQAETTPPNKHLQDVVMEKNGSTKSFKENMTEKWSAGKERARSKGKMQVSTTQYNDMDEDVEDSEVLQLLHKDVIESTASENPSLPSNVQCNSYNIKGMDNTSQMMDVASGASFEIIASKLKEALEVVLEHTITAVVVEKNKAWVITFVYASPSIAIRRVLWEYLTTIQNCFKGPWVVMGDFNEIINSSEKRGGRKCFSKTGFEGCINSNLLIDIGFVAKKFTWMTRRGFGEDIWERLDRDLCFMEWRAMFDEGYIRHLPRISSDHCPIVLCLRISHIPRSSLKPFKFEAMWIKHKGFGNLVKTGWDRNGGSLSDKISNLSNDLKVWNKEVFGCIFHNKRRIFARLQGLQTRLGEKYEPGLARLESKLRIEYDQIIEQEEIF